MKREIAVVGAVLVRDGRILCVQRGHGQSLAGRWEFPGGKIEPGESPEAALVREIDEELGCIIEVGRQVAVTTYEYDFAVVTLTTFYCSLVACEPSVTEHVALRWLAPAELDAVDWAPADIPAAQQIRDEFLA